MKRLLLLLPLCWAWPTLAQAPPVQNEPSAATPAAARPAPATHPALNGAQQAQVHKQDAEMASAGLRVAQMMDGNRAGELWEGASAVAKKAVNKQAFVSQLTADRTRLGALVGRGEAGVTRVKYGAGAAVPEGLYINVSFPTRFANSAQPVRELVSFRFDEDKVWRLAGYSLRAPGP